MKNHERICDEAHFPIRFGRGEELTPTFYVTVHDNGLEWYAIEDFRLATEQLMPWDEVRVLRDRLSFLLDEAKP